MVLFAFFLTGKVEANSIPFRLYSIADGLPHENIQTLEQTPDGRLWVGTSAGLTFFTGSGFVPVRFLEASSTANILEIEPLDNDDVWVSTNQLGVWQVRYRHAVRPFRELRNVRASRLMAHNDTLFVFSDQALWQVSLANEQLSKIPYLLPTFIKQKKSTPNIVSADISEDGSRWILDLMHGPGKMSADGTVMFVEDMINEGWHSIRFDHNGIAWITHEQDGLYRFDPVSGTLDLVVNEAGIQHICITPSMAVVTSESQGALYWSLAKSMLVSPMHDMSALPTKRVNCLYSDHEGNGWIGTQIGLIRISHPGVNHLMQIENHALLNLQGVHTAKDGSVWTVSSSEGLFQLYPKTKSVVGSGEEKWSDLISGQDGKLYALGSSGWHRYKADLKWDRVESFAGASHGEVDRNGIGYFWHPDGIYRHRKGRPAMPIMLWPAFENDTYRQALSPKGNLMVWANGKLIEVPNPAQAKLGTEKKLIREALAYRNTPVQDVVVDLFDRTWVALSKNGILCIDADTTIQLLPGYHINELSVAGDSLLIANAREGLFVFNLPAKMINDVQQTAQKGTHLDSRASVRYHLTQADGLMASTVTGAVFTKTTLWTTHRGGVSQIPQKLLKRESPIPQVLLTSINYNGIARSPFRQIDLSASDRNIGFEFSATTFSHMHKVHYRYRLKGHSKRWKETSQPYVQYAHLPAGEYEFEVQAATSGETYGETIGYDFVIPVPYYQMPVFWMGILILMTAIFYYLHLYRLRSMLQVERTRTQIAMDLHDDIGSSLTSLAFLSNLAWQRTEQQTPKEQISPLLQEIGSMSSELVDSMLDIVWSVDPKQDSVGCIISRLQSFYQRVHGGSEISVNWKVEEGIKTIALPPRSRRNLYLILKESVNNAIKHSGTSRIDISISEDLATLHVVVQDFGNGFDADVVKGGYGLSSMQERAQESGATFNLRSSKDTSTTIYIKWPLRKYASGSN